MLVMIFFFYVKQVKRNEESNRIKLALRLRNLDSGYLSKPIQVNFAGLTS